MHAGYIPLSQNGTQPCSEEGLNGTVVNPAFPTLYRSLVSLTSTLFLSVRVLITKGIKIDEHHVHCKRENFVNLCWAMRTLLSVAYIRCNFLNLTCVT